MIFSFLSKWRSYKLVLVLLCLLMYNLIYHARAFAQPGASTILKNLIENADKTHAPIILLGGLIRHNDLLRPFYERSQYTIAWQNEKNVNELINTIRKAENEGLNPNDYHLYAIEKYHELLMKNTQETVGFDLLLTDAFLSYAMHLHYGKVDPEKLYADKWEGKIRELNLVALLEEALNNNSVANTLAGLGPTYPGYAKLKTVLHVYKGLQSEKGWPSIGGGVLLKPGMSDDRIPLIRRRLTIVRQFPLGSPDSRVYDSMLCNAVRTFQRMNGLVDDGVIGDKTLQVLNYSVGNYIDQIKINMERYRWCFHEPDSTFIQVNIPDFNAEVWQNDSLLFTMRVIVGRADRKTPVLSSHMSSLIYNPTWTVPPTILEEDVLPVVKKNLDYLKTHHLRVIDNEGIEVNPEGLQWKSYSIHNFPYMLRQDPGSFNSLGLIKFEFPNRHRVYLHDTNNRALFNEPNRALSSGCIRIEKPLDLAIYLLRNSSWTREKLEGVIALGRTGTIFFKQPMPIHIVYFTAFVDEGDHLQLREDIYGWDQPLLNELIENPKY